MPSPSPTTTRAVKLKRRPPCTTLATRLMATTRSTYWLFSAPPRRSSRPPPRRSPPERCPRWAPLMRCPLPLLFCACQPCEPWSEGQSALTGGIGEGRNAAVVLVARAVEDDGLDARALRPLGHQLADLLGLGGLVALEGAQVGFHGGGRDQRLAHEVVDDLHADVLGRPGHDQARPVRGARDLLAAPHLTVEARLRAGRSVLVLGQGDTHVTYQPFRPCGGCARRRSARPCPCRARACGACGCSQRPRQPAACRCPGRRAGSARRR